MNVFAFKAKGQSKFERPLRIPVNKGFIMRFPCSALPWKINQFITIFQDDGVLEMKPFACTQMDEVLQV